MYGQKAFVCQRKWDALVYMFEDDVVYRGSITLMRYNFSFFLWEKVNNTRFEQHKDVSSLPQAMFQSLYISAIHYPLQHSNPNFYFKFSPMISLCYTNEIFLFRHLKKQTSQ